VIDLAAGRVRKGWATGRHIETALETDIWHPNGFGRRYSMREKADGFEDAFAAFGLKPHSVEPVFKILTGNHYIDGVHTHMHQDTAPEGFAHVRCNTMLRKPTTGGMPLFGEESIEVEIGDLWIVLASLEQHGSTPMFGGERVIFSYGALVPMEQVTEITKK